MKNWRSWAIPAAVPWLLSLILFGAWIQQRTVSQQVNTLLCQDALDRRQIALQGLIGRWEHDARNEATRQLVEAERDIHLYCGIPGTGPQEPDIDATGLRRAMIGAVWHLRYHSERTGVLGTR